MLGFSRKEKCAKALKRLLRKRNLDLDALLPTLYQAGFTEAEIRFALVELKKREDKLENDINQLLKPGQIAYMMRRR